MSDLRQYQRATVDLPLEFTTKGSSERAKGRARDVSVGGMFIETSTPLGFSAELTIHLTLPKQKAPSVLPAVVRWTRPGGMGVQFGPLGARETYAITELTRNKG